MTVVPRGHKGLAKPANVNINRAFFNEDMVAPDMIEKLVAAMDALGMGDEEVKKSKLGGAKLQGASVAANTVGEGV